MKSVTRRNIIRIDEERCNGCGLCVPSCAEGAIQIIDGKARLVSEKFCDGLGACLGECPQDALQIIETEAEDFDEEAVRVHLGASRSSAHAGQGEPVARSDPRGYPTATAFQSGARHGDSARACPSARMMHFQAEETSPVSGSARPSKSCLSQWPVQLMLVPPEAPYFRNADILVTADCVPFALAGFHEELLKGKAVVVGCPKLDDVGYYAKKLAQIFSAADAKSVTVATMEVPCCSGLLQAVYEAVDSIDRPMPVYAVKVGIRGQILSQARSR